MIAFALDTNHIYITTILYRKVSSKNCFMVLTSRHIMCGNTFICMAMFHAIVHYSATQICTVANTC